MNEKRPKRKKDILDKIAELLDLPKMLEYDDDSLFDSDMDAFYSNVNKKNSFNDIPESYDDEELINKLIMNELLNVEDMEKLIERVLKEFKRTFSAPTKNIEIVFREYPKNHNKTHRKFDYRNTKDNHFYR